MLIPALALALLLPQEVTAAQEVFPKGGGAEQVARILKELDKCDVVARPFSVADEDIHEEVVVTPDETRLTDSGVDCLANNPGWTG